VSRSPLPLVVGLPGPIVGQSERKTLDRVRPAGVILFTRNIISGDQTRDLVTALKDLDPRPFVCIDLEGGAVNRLKPLWGELPAPSAAAVAGECAVRIVGEAAGAACRALGIQLDLAPVVDLERPNSLISRQQRTLGRDPQRVAELARLFAEGLQTWHVSGCIKHYPGLGPIGIDTHEELATLEESADDLAPHLAAFSELSTTIPAVMVAHVRVPAMGDSEHPASLSPTIVERAVALPGSPIVLSDDLEMGALESLGDLPHLVVQALRARNHGALVCRAFHRLEEIADHLKKSMRDDPVLERRVHQAVARLGTLGRDLCHQAAAIPAPDDDAVARLWERARLEIVE